MWEKHITLYEGVGIVLSMCEWVRQRQAKLNERKTLLNTKGVYGTKFENGMHFMPFAAIVTITNGTEGSNFHIRNDMTTTIEMSGNRLVNIAGSNSTTMLTKSSP